jgi:sodium/potassium-transporting ATPase subunit alpha
VSPNASIFSTGIRGNSLIAWGVLAEIAVVLASYYSDGATRFFGTAPLRASDWLFIIPVALGMLFLEELRKSVTRRLDLDS